MADAYMKYHISTLAPRTLMGSSFLLTFLWCLEFANLLYSYTLHLAFPGRKTHHVWNKEWLIFQTKEVFDFRTGLELRPSCHFRPGRPVPKWSFRLFKQSLTKFQQDFLYPSSMMVYTQNHVHHPSSLRLILRLMAAPTYMPLDDYESWQEWQ
jgi:hypothetical protein